MQLQNPTTNFMVNHKNVLHAGGKHSPQFREPIDDFESDSSSFQFTEEEFFGLGSSYGSHLFSESFSANPDYADSSLYGPGYDDPLSSYFGFKTKK
jgi:hypothetical protein